MKKIVLLLILAVLAWKWQDNRSHSKTAVARQEVAREQEEEQVTVAEAAAPAPRRIEAEAAPSYACDGRKYCSQMKSCEEATYFLQHCPGVKMDGDNDGIPCEQQWCSGH